MNFHKLNKVSKPESRLRDEILSTPKKSVLYPLLVTTLKSNNCPYFYHHHLVFVVLHLHGKGIVKYSWVWLLSLNVMVRFIQLLVYN